MTQHIFTEQEIHSLCEQYAKETMPHPATYYGDNAKNWFEEFVQRYNKLRNAVIEYNQELGG